MQRGLDEARASDLGCLCKAPPLPVKFPVHAGTELAEAFGGSEGELEIMQN